MSTLPPPPWGLKPRRGDPFHPLSLDGCRHLPQADLSGWQHRRLGGVCCHCLDGRPDGIQMTPPGGDLNTNRTLLRQGTHGCSAFFCACLKSSVIWNRPGHFPLWVGRDHINDILCVVVFPTRFGNSFSCCVMPSHSGRSRLPPSPFLLIAE